MAEWHEYISTWINPDGQTKLADHCLVWALRAPRRKKPDEPLYCLAKTTEVISESQGIYFTPIQHIFMQAGSSLSYNTRLPDCFPRNSFSCSVLFLFSWPEGYWHFEFSSLNHKHRRRLWQEDEAGPLWTLCSVPRRLAVLLCVRLSSFLLPTVPDSDSNAQISI